MRLRRWTALVGAALALGAIAASSASAVVTEPAEWFVVDPVEKTLEKPTTFDAEIANHTKTELGARFTVFTEIAGQKVDVTFGQVECLGCTAQNRAITGEPVPAAFASGKLRLAQAKVDAPEGCGFASETGVAGEVQTRQLSIHADLMHQGKAFWHFFPEAGEVFASFKLTGGGCPIAGAYQVKGSVYGEMRAGTGALLEKHEIDFGPTVQTTAGGSPLRLGAIEVKLTGTAAFSMTKEGKRVIYTVR